jgi:hypothetical protein
MELEPAAFTVATRKVNGTFDPLAGAERICAEGTTKGKLCCRIYEWGPQHDTVLEQIFLKLLGGHSGDFDLGKARLSASGRRR